MTDIDPRDRGAPSLGFGAYEIVRPLRPGLRGERYLVVDPERLTHHVAFRVPLPATVDREMLLDAVSAASRIDCPHVLPIEQFAFAAGDASWVISPYTGDHDGLLLLADLLRDKGGQFDAGEVSRAVGQLIEAMDAIHRGAMPHGELTLGCVQVDRSGRLLVELPGLGLDVSTPIDDARRSELRSVVRVAYELLTGVLPGDQVILPSKLVENLSPGWDRFISEGLDPAGGFGTADELREGLDRVFDESPVVEVRSRRATRRMGFIRRRSGV